MGGRAPPAPRARVTAPRAPQRAVVATCRHVAHALGNLLTGLSLSLELLEGTALAPEQRRYLERALHMGVRLGAYQETLVNLGGGGRAAAGEVDTAALLRSACALYSLPPQRIALRVAPGAERTFGHAALLHEALAALLRPLAEACGEAGVLQVSARAVARGVQLRLAASHGAEGPQRGSCVDTDDDAASIDATALLWAATIVEEVHGGTLAWTVSARRGAAAQLTLPSRGVPA